MDKTAQKSPNHRILVMEDDPGIGGMLRTILIEKGYDVVLISQGGDAIRWLADNTPDLALLDLHVPEKTGFDVMKSIRENDQRNSSYIPVIVLTGVYTSRHDKVHALDLGADDFLPKPFDLLELLARVRSLLRVQELYKKSQFLATHDPLTGCYNRRYLMDFLDRECQRFKRYKTPLSFLMVDMDGFKGINDRLGHEAGDRALVFMASSMKEFFRGVDCVARIGGDEFAVVLPSCDHNESKKVAARLIQFIQAPERRALLPEALRNEVHFSAGLASIPHHTKNQKELIHLADQALYAAKKAGHDQFRISAA